MNERPLNDNPLSPVQRLANLYDSLADDVFDAPIEIDEETKVNASRTVRAAIDQAFGDPQSAPKNASKWSLWHKLSDFFGWTGPMYAVIGAPPSLDEAPFARRFGLRPIIATALTVIALAFSGFAWITMGFGVILEVPAALLIGLLTRTLQKRLCGDDNRAASSKGIATALLLAVPNPIAPFVFVIAGIIGLVWGKKLRKDSSEIPPK